MESQRSLLFIALLVVSFLLYQQWQIDHAPKPAPVEITTPSSSVPDADESDVPLASQSALPTTTSQVSTKKVTVTTDVLAVDIDTLGGDLIKVNLLAYETELGSGEAFTLLDKNNLNYIAQSGLIGAQGPDGDKSGRPRYQVDGTSFNLNDGQDSLIVNLHYVDQNNIQFTKRFTFSRGSYHVDIEYFINNQSDATASVQLYGQLKQSTLVKETSGMLMTFRGAAYGSDETRYEKLDFDDLTETKLNVATQGGWVAMLQHYFVSAWIPRTEQSNTLYSSQYSNNQAAIGVKSAVTTIEPGETKSVKGAFYVGPKDQDALAALADGLDLTVDYGILFFISQPLFWLLIKIQQLVTNWGLAIIAITIVVKTFMYPLTKAQYTSMAKMRKLQPKLQALKDRFGDDKQKITQGMLELYKKEKVNPAGGCFPLMLQMPIFLALYWVFVESVELRHAPFMLWIDDLSAMDPYFVLPLFMGISMYIMQKMQPMTIQDPMQQKIMQYMPVMFSIFMAWFPSGLVLYWFISNVISIIQMKIIFAGIEKAEANA